MIDPKKPLRFRMPDMRPVKLVGVMPNGDIVVVTTMSSGENATDWCARPIIYDPQGRMRNGDAFTPVLVNDVVVDSGFYPLASSGAPVGRGLIALPMAMSDYPDVEHFLEIVRHDGVPKEAKIHARP